MSTRVQICGYADRDRCSLPYESEWFASIYGHGYTDTGAQTRIDVAWPLIVSTEAVDTMDLARVRRRRRRSVVRDFTVTALQPTVFVSPA